MMTTSPMKQENFSYRVVCEPVLHSSDVRRIDTNTFFLEFFTPESITDAPRSSEKFREIHIRKDARVLYVCFFSDEISGKREDAKKIFLENGAQAKIFNFYFGGAEAHIHTEAEIQAGANCQWKTFFVGNNKQRFIIEENFSLKGRGSYARFRAQGIFLDASEGEYLGNIHVEKNAQETDSKLELQSFIVGRGARGTLVPKLEIEANNVKAGHSATVSRIQEEELFYLGSRGLSKSEALELFLEGIFLDVLKEIPHNEYISKIKDSLRRKYRSIASL